MSQIAVQEHYYSKEDYLDLEEQAEYKSEYYDGEIFAMAGGSGKHSRICFNVIRGVGNAIGDKDCVGFESNLKLDIPKYNLVVYPDAMVGCGRIEFLDEKQTVLKNPVLVIEVLSPSTENFDRAKKFVYYQSVPSIREYVLISQSEPKIEVYYKQDEKNWLYTISQGLEDTILLRTLDRDLALRDIYQKIAWEEVKD